MGCVTATAKRRRRQAKMGYRHIHKAKRPHYKRVDAATSAARLRAQIVAERQRKMRGAK